MLICGLKFLKRPNQNLNLQILQLLKKHVRVPSFNFSWKYKAYIIETEYELHNIRSN